MSELFHRRIRRRDASQVVRAMFSHVGGRARRERMRSELNERVVEEESSSGTEKIVWAAPNAPPPSLDDSAVANPADAPARRGDGGVSSEFRGCQARYFPILGALLSHARPYRRRLFRVSVGKSSCRMRRRARGVPPPPSPSVFAPQASTTFTLSTVSRGRRKLNCNQRKLNCNRAGASRSTDDIARSPIDRCHSGPVNQVTDRPRPHSSPAMPADARASAAADARAPREMRHFIARAREIAHRAHGGVLLSMRAVETG